MDLIQDATINVSCLGCIPSLLKTNKKINLLPLNFSLGKIKDF